MAVVEILLPPAWLAGVVALVRKYQQTCPESLYCWLPVASSCNTS